MGMIEKRIEQLGLELPSNTPFGGNMVAIKQHDRLLYTSGVGPFGPDGKSLWTGKLGVNLTIEEGYQAARQCGLVLLGVLKKHLGDLDRIDSIIKVLGFVAGAPTFYSQPQVMHGFSDIMVEVFGEQGKHTRSAIGVSSLPGNIPVEVEMIVSIKE